MLLDLLTIFMDLPTIQLGLSFTMHEKVKRKHDMTTRKICIYFDSMMRRVNLLKSWSHKFMH